jgi:poly(A) polymerase
MTIPSIPWTDQRRQVLRELQQRQLLRRLLAFAEQSGVRLYAVGGTLRDICLGRPAQDLDLALAGDVMGFTRGLANHLGAAYVPLDAEQGEARIVYRKRDVLDFARLKGDDILEDLQHRDFTINAMACPLPDLLTQAAPDLIDPHGGWRDLQARVIRMVSDRSFHEDPLRLLRAFRLVAALEFALDPSTLAAMQPVAARLDGVAAERVHSELLKLFAAPHSSPHVRTMARLGLLDVLFPELATTRGMAQQSDDQPDLFEHAILTYRWVEDLINTPGSYLPAILDAVVEYLQREERRALVKWASLLHAIGNAGLHREAAPGCQPSPDVAARSARQWEQIGSRLKLSRQRIEYIRTLIAHYHRLFTLASLEAQGHLMLRPVHRWCKELGGDILGVFVLAVGHTLARGQVNTPAFGAIALGQCAAHVWSLYRDCIVPVMRSPRLVTGDDLQQIFNLTPGPRFKTLLDELEVAQVEGRIHTRAEALQWVEQRLS